MLPSSIFRSFRPIGALCIPRPMILRPFSNTTPAFAKDIKSLDETLGNVQNTMLGLIPGVPRFTRLVEGEWSEDRRHHLHIYTHKHNTHITLTKPNRDAVISLSCGNIGFKKSHRGTYDAAHQLAAYVLARIQDKGLLMSPDPDVRIEKMELVFRGFGPGREAVIKALLGSEGRLVRPLIDKLSDSTRLKFGGTRSKKPRRLG